MKNNYQQHAKSKNEKLKDYRRCEVCKKKFHRNGTRALVCQDEHCRDEYKRRMAKRRMYFRRLLLEEIKRDKCLFSLYDNCRGSLNCHLKDGRIFRDISGTKQSTIYMLKNEDFESIDIKNDLRVLCSRHLEMVLSVEEKGGDWEDVIAYVLDKEIFNAEDEKEIK